MSANNWRQCPKCLREAREAKEKQVAAAGSAYGKVPPAEYSRLAAEASAPGELEDTLREDWEIGTEEDGEFYVSYSAACEECRYSFRFKHKQGTLPAAG